MKDVARLAGVSPTTVSFVINQSTHSNIPEETQERVWDAVRELDYRPNAMARGLRAQQTHTIGFISDVVATTPYAGQMIQGAQDLAWQHGYLLLLISTGGNRQMEETGVEMFLERQVDGIIYATMYHRAVTPPDAIDNVPTVLLDCFVEDHSLPSVVPDEVRGGREAIEHILARGHRRIGFVADDSTVPAQVGRLQGYQIALQGYGIEFDPSLVVAGQSTPAGGYNAAMTLLQQENPPTALFCFNDRMAMGVYNAARKLGLSIPDDLAVVGFDNQELIVSYLDPPLTTMHLPHYEMGQWAVEHLLHTIAAPDTQDAAQQHRIDCPLIERASV